MDFISFNSPSSDKRASSSPAARKQNNGSSSGAKTTGTNSKLAFGSPALAFGSPAVGFGSPAVSFGSPAVSPLGGASTPAFGSPAAVSRQCASPANNSFSPSQQKPHTPRRYNSAGSPRTYGNNSPNPRFQNSSPYTSSPNGINSGRQYHSEGSHFKTPYQYSPGRGRGSGRKSFPGQSPYHRNSNTSSGGINIQEYYHPSMLEDPWQGMVAVPAKS